MADEQDQGEPVSLGAIGLKLNDALSRLNEKNDSHVRRDAVLQIVNDIKEMVRRGIQWNAEYGTADPKIKQLQAENAELRAEADRLEKRNAQMAATAQDGIDQRDALRRENTDLTIERDAAMKDRDKWYRYYQAALKDDSIHVKEIHLREAAHEETKQEVEHLKRELSSFQAVANAYRTAYGCLLSPEPIPEASVVAGFFAAHREPPANDPIATAWGEMGRETQVAVDLETEDAIQTICLPPGSRLVAVIVASKE